MLYTNDVTSTKDRSFSADSKHSADHSLLLRFPHLRWSRLYSGTGGSPIDREVLSTKDVNLKPSNVHVYHAFLYVWTQAYVNLRKYRRSPGTNRKRVCDFLLVINSNLGPIFPRFRDIAGFLRRATPLTPIPPELGWVFPLD